MPDQNILVRNFVWVPYGSPGPGKRQPYQLAHIAGSGQSMTDGTERHYLYVYKYQANSRRWTQSKIKVDRRAVIFCTPADLPQIDRAANGRGLTAGPGGRR